MPCCYLHALAAFMYLWSTSLRHKPLSGLRCATASNAFVGWSNLTVREGHPPCVSPGNCLFRHSLYQKCLSTASFDLGTQVILRNSWVPGTEGHSVTIGGCTRIFHVHHFLSFLVCRALAPFLSVATSEKQALGEWCSREGLLVGWAPLAPLLYCRVRAFTVSRDSVVWALCFWSLGLLSCAQTQLPITRLRHKNAPILHLSL